MKHQIKQALVTLIVGIALVSAFVSLLSGCTTPAALVSDSKGAWVNVQTDWGPELYWCSAETEPVCRMPVKLKH